MVVMLRPSAQLAARVRLSIRTRPATHYPRLVYRLYGSPRAVHVANATARRRHYSSQPPRKPQSDGEGSEITRKNGGSDHVRDDSESKAGLPESPKTGEDPVEPEAQVPLPSGWVRLNEAELQQLSEIYKGFPNNNAFIKLLENIKSTGAPKELRDLLEKKKNRGLGIMDGFAVIRTVRKLAEEMAKSDTDQMKLGEGTGAKQKENFKFNSNKPDQQAKPEQKNTPSDQGDEGKQNKQEEQGTGRQLGKSQPSGLNGSDPSSWVAATLILYTLYWLLYPVEISEELSWQEVRTRFLDKGLVRRMVVIGPRVRVELDRDAVKSVYPDSSVTPTTYYFSIGSPDAFERKLEQAEYELGIPSEEHIPVSYARESGMSRWLMAFGPTILLFVFLSFIGRRMGSGGGAGGMFNFSKSRAKMFNHDAAVKVKFSDVAGMDEAKMEIMEFVSFLKNPDRFRKLGAKIPRGAILAGPPGTGKTLLAKATAGESGVPFYSVSGSEFVEMFVGVGASRVRDLFATARKNSPCIVFIDEIDAIGRSRDSGGFRSGGNDEREATLNQILTEMDGFNTAEQVVVLAGTNRPDILDKALMRPGRFDRHINIDPPTMAGRRDIFRVHLDKIVTNEDGDYLTGRLAALTPGFSGADIANVVNEAALIAARANASSVEMMHFEKAIERVIGGLERKSLVLDPEQRRTVAYHEAGHAICGWYLRWADPLLKVSIIPRGSAALGYAQYLPSDAYLMTTSQLMDRMAMTLGGRISEELHFPAVTTGGSDDFKKVTHMARTMVTQWGMSEKLGPLHFSDDPNQLQKPFAESTSQTIDAEVRRLVDEAYQQCKNLLSSRKKEIGLVAEELLRSEMLTRDDLVRLLGPREWPEKEEFSKYFGNAGSALVPEHTDEPSMGAPEDEGRRPAMFGRLPDL